MVGFHMMHQGARENVFPATREKGVGTLLMFAVRSIFADPPRVAREMKELAAKGLVENMARRHRRSARLSPSRARRGHMIEAAYRFARHEPGVDVVLFGTGDAEHLRSNVASLLKPPLPEADRAKLAALFGHLQGVGLDGHQGRDPIVLAHRAGGIAAQHLAGQRAGMDRVFDDRHAVDQHRGARAARIAMRIGVGRPLLEVGGIEHRHVGAITEP